MKCSYVQLLFREFLGFPCVAFLEDDARPTCPASDRAPETQYTVQTMCKHCPKTMHTLYTQCILLYHTVSYCIYVLLSSFIYLISSFVVSHVHLDKRQRIGTATDAEYKDHSWGLAVKEERWEWGSMTEHNTLLRLRGWYLDVLSQDLEYNCVHSLHWTPSPNLIAFACCRDDSTRQAWGLVTSKALNNIQNIMLYSICIVYDIYRHGKRFKTVGNIPKHVAATPAELNWVNLSSEGGFYYKQKNILVFPKFEPKLIPLPHFWDMKHAGKVSLSEGSLWRHWFNRKIWA